LEVIHPIVGCCPLRSSKLIRGSRSARACIKTVYSEFDPKLNVRDSSDLIEVVQHTLLLYLFIDDIPDLFGIGAIGYE
jgi:hypothetical protein